MGCTRARRSSPTPEEVQQRLGELGPEARTLLEHVVEQGGEATTGTSRHTVLPDDAATPAEELLSRRLLVPRSGGVVIVPGEVGLALRGGRTTAERADVPPVVATAERDPRWSTGPRRARRSSWYDVPSCSSTTGEASPRACCAGAGWRCASCAPRPPDLHVDEPTAALVVETAAAAGLLAERADTDGNPVWVPTDAFDVWSGRDLAERWLIRWLGAGWRARGCPPWSAPATATARPATRWRPTSPARPWSRPAR